MNPCRYGAKVTEFNAMSNEHRIEYTADHFVEWVDLAQYEFKTVTAGTHENYTQGLPDAYLPEGHASGSLASAVGEWVISCFAPSRTEL